MGSRTTPKKIATSVKFAPRKLEALKRIAAAHDRTVSEHIRWVVDRDIEEQKEIA